MFRNQARSIGWGRSLPRSKHINLDVENWITTSGVAKHHFLFAKIFFQVKGILRPPPKKRIKICYDLTIVQIFLDERAPATLQTKCYVPGNNYFAGLTHFLSPEKMFNALALNRLYNSIHQFRTNELNGLKRSWKHASLLPLFFLRPFSN